MAKKRDTRMRTGYGTIKCRGTRRCIRNGAETGELWGIRVTVANPQRTEMKDMASNINDAMSLTETDVLAAWRALEGEIGDAGGKMPSLLPFCSKFLKGLRGTFAKSSPESFTFPAFRATIEATNKKGDFL